LDEMEEKSLLPSVDQSKDPQDQVKVEKSVQ